MCGIVTRCRLLTRWRQYVVVHAAIGAVPRRIEVVDKQNGWPVPLVQLRTTHNVLFVTDNAGVIAFDEHYGVAFKVETHNHPSAISTKGGIETKHGGVLRDIIVSDINRRPDLELIVRAMERMNSASRSAVHD